MLTKTETRDAQNINENRATSAFRGMRCMGKISQRVHIYDRVNCNIETTDMCAQNRHTR